MGSVRDKMVEQIRAAKRETVIAEPVVEAVVEVVEEVRARNENGHFIADDPTTPENEAWTKKPKAQKKNSSKKKSAAKKSKQIQ